MSLTKQEKNEILKSFGKNEKDSGSAEVQVALLSKRISHLRPHFKKHAHDYHSRTGLLSMVSRRRKMLDFLKKKDFDRYQSLIKELGLRR